METMEDKALRKLFAGGKRYYVRRSTLEEVIEKMTRLKVELELSQATKRRSITDTEREHILRVSEHHYGGLFVRVI